MDGPAGVHAQDMLKTKTPGAGDACRASSRVRSRSMRQRIGTNLNVYRERPRAFSKLVEPGRAVTAGAPKAAALPAGIRVVDARIQTLGVKSHRVWHPHQDHLPVFEADEAILEVGSRDRNVLSKPHRVVLVDPG